MFCLGFLPQLDRTEIRINARIRALACVKFRVNDRFTDCVWIRTTVRIRLISRQLPSIAVRVRVWVKLALGL